METIPLDVTVDLKDADPFLDGSDAEQAENDYMDRRGAERAPMDCPVRFTPEERLEDGSKVEGTLLDISKTGCRIYSLEPPAPGNHILLILPLPDGEPPMCLIGTIVRHVRGHEFGAEFLPLSAEGRRRLQAIIFKHMTWSVYSLRRPAFRIA
jgi:c-di-GMP-binding flagellar brake protein YcgR